MPRFVLLFHDCPHDVPRSSHCDLMFESDGVLRTWVLTELPRDWAAPVSKVPENVGKQLQFAAGNAVTAEPLGDHRLAYLDYEGPVSGNRGNVRRLDGGTFETIRETPDCWEVALAGKVLQGPASLRRTAGDSLMWQLTVGEG